jgi:hypothetical protein
MERNIVTVLLFDFLIVTAVTLAASAIIAFILTNVIVGWVKRSDVMHGIHKFWNPIDRRCATSGSQPVRYLMAKS